MGSLQAVGPIPPLTQKRDPAQSFSSTTKVSCIWFAGWVSFIFFIFCMQDASGLSVRWVACVENRHDLAGRCRAKAPQAPWQVFGPDRAKHQVGRSLSDLRHLCLSCPTPLSPPALRGRKTNTRTMVETSPNCDGKRYCTWVSSLAFSFKGVRISQKD